MGSEFHMQVFFLLTVIRTTLGDVTLYYMTVRLGERANLTDGFKLDRGPPPTFVEWIRDNHSDITIVGRIQHEIGSSWRTTVSDNETFAINSKGDLEIKNMDVNLEGIYEQRSHNETFVGYDVRITEQDSTVDVLDVRQRYEESPIPNGVRRKWVIKFNVSTGLKSDCRSRKTVHLCRENSTKPGADKKKCEPNKIICTVHISSCTFTLVYNDTRNFTSNFQFYLKFSLSDARDEYKPRLFLLTTYTKEQGHPYPTTTRGPESVISPQSTRSNAINQSTVTCSDSSSRGVSAGAFAWFVLWVVVAVAVVLLIVFFRRFCSSHTGCGNTESNRQA